MSREILVSVDIEADGPIPGPFSMLSFAAVALDRSDPNAMKVVAAFQANLQPLEGATQDPDTMAFWAKNPEAYKAATTNPRHPANVMAEFEAWLDKLPGKPVFVGYPVTYDFMWVYWYCWRFNGRKPRFGHSGLDIKTLAWSKLGHRSFHGTSKRAMPLYWFEGTPPHTHEALDDAIEQGVLLGNIMKDNRR